MTISRVLRKSRPVGCGLTLRPEQAPIPVSLYHYRMNGSATTLDDLRVGARVH